MATAKLYNIARMTTATTGTGTITLGAAATGFLTFALAGVGNGETVTYAIEDGSNREIGRGVYTSAGTTLTRTVLKSTNADSAISLSGSAQVFITAAAEDLTITQFTAETAVDTADELALYDASEGLNNKATVNNVFKAVNTFTAETAVDTADVLFLYDASAATGDKATVNEVFKAVSTFTAETAVDTADVLFLYDASATTADKATVNELFKAVNTFTAETSVDTADVLSLFDASASTADKCTVNELFKAVNSFTAETAPVAGDFLPLYDTSAGTADKVDAKLIGTGKQTIWVPATAMTAATTNGPATGTVEQATNKNMTKSLDFDTTTSEIAQFMIAFPKSWNLGTVTFIPHWTAASGSGTFISALSGVAISNDDALDVAFGTAQSSTDTLITAYDNHVGPESAAITIAGTPALGDLVNFKIVRDVSDTLGVDAKLIGIQLIYTTNTNTDD